MDGLTGYLKRKNSKQLLSVRNNGFTGLHHTSLQVFYISTLWGEISHPQTSVLGTICCDCPLTFKYSTGGCI